MSARTRCFLFVLLCGATLAPLGDHFHVVRGVTEYFTDFGPIWLGESPLWFAITLSVSMATLAVVQGSWLARRSDTPNPGGTRIPDTRVFGSPLFVLGLYLTTSFYPWRDGGSLEALLYLTAGGSFLALGGTRGQAFVGLLVATAGVLAEWILMQGGVFRYLPGSDELFGVAPWLPALYFSASICAGAIGCRMLSRPRQTWTHAAPEEDGDRVSCSR